MDKRVNGFSWHFQDSDNWDLVQGTISNILGMFHWTHCIQYVFESLSLTSITEKQLNGFSWNCQHTSDIRQGTIWNILTLLSILWAQGWFFYFLDPCLLATLLKAENGFLWNVQHMLGMTQQNIWLGCFTPGFLWLWIETWYLKPKLLQISHSTLLYHHYVIYVMPYLHCPRMVSISLFHLYKKIYITRGITPSYELEIYYFTSVLFSNETSYNKTAQIFLFSTLIPRQNDHNFPDDIFKCIFLNENV